MALPPIAWRRGHPGWLIMHGHIVKVKEAVGDFIVSYYFSLRTSLPSQTEWTYKFYFPFYIATTVPYCPPCCRREIQNYGYQHSLLLIKRLFGCSLPTVALSIREHRTAYEGGLHQISFFEYTVTLLRYLTTCLVLRLVWMVVKLSVLRRSFAVMIMSILNPVAN
ncbi:uncharacterized protein FOMMEDRAFT_151835 [Fomitiporia mediterranea MF3/22]|uniref:uncharacterized protein n=1 Tax=Fomitiporia mediterranea (strain MF3/22) TaxID=694068 RepID=UPI000440920B|nr:uncharacterized protein FOMMEDRAFT_151835 [Fomitiporia mediterranea MF3/22]EJD06566.1 hypothetical protein FOMMEDRAFT_151835 [Fomitiporia mediterranea MF3/22]